MSQSSVCLQLVVWIIQELKLLRWANIEVVSVRINHNFIQGQTVRQRHLCSKYSGLYADAVNTIPDEMVKFLLWFCQTRQPCVSQSRCPLGALCVIYWVYIKPLSCEAVLLTSWLGLYSDITGIRQCAIPIHVLSIKFITNSLRVRV